ncbi:hypothetical protein IJ541_08160 [bacterium]|nr:hypothetical protein [bacterium]
MEVLGSVREYRKYLPEYQDWRDKQELHYVQKKEYLKQNPDKADKDDIQRGKILLHAIDVMDEYSQSYAEDMEVATQFATGQVVGLATMLGTVGGTALAYTKSVKKFLGKFAGKGKGIEIVLSMLPTAIGMMVGFAASFPAILWATKAKVSASRKGRFEAMRNELQNPAIFAVLSDEQNKKAEELSKDIELDDKLKKRLKSRGMGVNPMDSIKTLKKYYSENGEFQVQKKEFDEKLKEGEKNFGSPLSESQIKNAKHDQQILAHMVRKIDIASQDYAENTELATNTLTTLSFAGGGLVGWVSDKLLKLMKVGAGSKFTKVIPWIVGATLPLIMGIYSAKVQKQASRIGRYKAKQDMLNNPESLVYVDKNDYEKMSDIKTPQQAKKPNMFKFFLKLLKDNKEYEQYRKTILVEELKRHKAVENLELSEKQINDAKALQMNVFKTFNKVDEKSQTYSESVEAVGEMVKQGVSVFGTLGATAVSTWQVLKMLENPKALEGDFSKVISKSMTKFLVPFGFVLLPIILVDIYTTKAQKKASRVADMLALKELEDYRHYAGYSDYKNEDSSKSVEAIKNSSDTNLLKSIVKFY